MLDCSSPDCTALLDVTIDHALQTVTCQSCGVKQAVQYDDVGDEYVMWLEPVANPRELREAQ